MVELDPWGADTTRSSAAAFQPKKFTSYERDPNGSDEAMFRRYNRKDSRFVQPDPYDGSYEISDPQSFNRHGYVQNDPVNFVDPLGLDDCPPGTTPAIDPANNQITCVSNVGASVTITAPRDSGVGRIFSNNDFLVELGSDLVGDPQSSGFEQKKKNTGPPLKPTPPDDKEVQRRIAEGQAWDKWYKWVNCNTPIMNKYNAKINDLRRPFGPAFSRDIGAGFGVFTVLFADSDVVGVVAAILVVWGSVNQIKAEAAEIRSNYYSEVTKVCGPKPPHP